ncbi:MAG TPA: hypothetical protein VJ937_10130 [Salinivirga sp.]|uniref:hypothetical protein n=1 Tax=Salinivirga sp. TaxID=1970192 RepID=UPI002B45BE5C|nr:hypothetical protein [Salinivirga sp.]HKK59827.1 hypothetical protein [Salinivirga sp.]
MSNIEEYIKKNRAAFDSEEPRAGHEARFLAKLPRQKNRTVIYLRYAAAAAVIAFLVTLSGLYIHDNWIAEPTQKLPTLADAGPKYAEAEAYFVSTIQHQRNTIDKLSGDNMQVEKAQMEKDLKEMDKLYKQLQKDLDANPGDPRVINAMIKHYQTRINVMKQIVEQLQEAKRIKSHKTQNHEKVSL